MLRFTRSLLATHVGERSGRPCLTLKNIAYEDELRIATEVEAVLLDEGLRVLEPAASS
jgi:hypothetical protein